MTCVNRRTTKHLRAFGPIKIGQDKMKFIVRFGGFILWEGDDVDEADEILQGCGPYGTLEVEE